MSFKIEKLARNNIRNLNPYESARRLQSTGKIWMNANEYPVSKDYLINQKNLNRYPDFQPKKIIKKYANYIGIIPEEILVTRGADEGIELLMKAFCNPETDSIMIFPPTYGMYKITADILGIINKPISLNNKWQLNIKTILKNLDNVKLIYICNPNNPTANLIQFQDILILLKYTEKKTIVVIDEAYIEFCISFSLVKYLKKYHHLVILRTLSKAFSLAGIRCGFILANKKIINLLMKVISPYPIPVPTSYIAEKALCKREISLMKSRISKLINIRKWFISKIKLFKSVEKIFESNTNYILVKFYEGNKIFEFFRTKGIIFRNQNQQIGLLNCLRITIGTYEECKKVILILKNL